MTNENAIKQLKRMKMDKSHTGDEYNAIMTAIKALEQEPCDDAFRFCNWVAEEIFDENWQYNQDAFAEIACRKLEKMGIVKIIGENWELVESEEQE